AVVARDPSRVDVLVMRIRLEIYSRMPYARNSGHQCWHVVTQEFPLFAADVVALVGDSLASDLRKNRADAFRMRIRQASQHERIHDRKDRRVRANGQREGND